jgi:ribosomal protein L31E
MVDRLLTINLRNYLVRQPVRKRHMRISRYVRGRVSHYMKVEEENVRLSGDLNILMIKRHSKSMLPLKVNVKIENGIATVSPFAQPKAAAAPAATAKKEAAKTEKKATEPRTAAKADAKKEAKPAAATK